MMTNKTVNKSHLNGSGTPAASAAGGATTTEQPAAEPQAVPNPEATPKAKRRSFSAAYKKRILKEAEQCDQHGQIGALLRREGLYSSQLTEWRRQAEAGKLGGTKSKKRGRPAEQTAEEKELKRLRRENERLQKKLAQAQLIIEAQKKVAALIEMVSESNTEGKS